jgi:predicted dehydrogenase
VALDARDETVDRKVTYGRVQHSWAARAHVPALRALSESYEIVGVANTSLASAEKAAAATGLPRAFADVAELVAAQEVDVVTVTVKVPHHFEIVKAAIKAGKHVYCEWPLGNGLDEAEELAELARAKGVLGVVGTQARVAPEIEHLRQLIADGFVGEVLSTTLVARGGGWGGSIAEKKISAYLLDRANGATMLTIPVGHTLAALMDVLGEVAEVSAVLATRRTSALAVDTGETLSVSAPDQVLVSGLLAPDRPDHRAARSRPAHGDRTGGREIGHSAAPGGDWRRICGKSTIPSSIPAIRRSPLRNGPSGRWRRIRRGYVNRRGDGEPWVDRNA